AHDAVFVDDVAGHLPTAATMGLTVVHHVRTSDTLTELERLFAIDL
ncbi:MAG: hypothetical protein QOE61_1284, partial [Micromonosporaceae bacterium]|nr:hypothetical protein [Micromonosporaceae bacterium]